MRTVIAMKQSIFVWDLPLRVFHWLLAGGLIAAWATAEFGYEEQHLWVGYSILTLLIFRLVWGFVGTYHAQFKHFVRLPSLANFKADDDTLGHSARGGWAVVAMLLFLLVQASSGLFTFGEIWSGPYAEWLGQKWLTKVHHINFNIVAALVGLHLVAIGFYQIVKKRPLITAMFSGTKQRDADQDEASIPHSKLVVAFVVLLLAGLAVFALVTLAPEVEYDSYYY